MEGGHVVLFCDEVHDAVEGDLADGDRLVVDVDVFEEHRVKIFQHPVIGQDHAVHQHENVVQQELA